MGDVERLGVSLWGEGDMDALLRAVHPLLATRRFSGLRRGHSNRRGRMLSDHGESYEILKRRGWGTPVVLLATRAVLSRFKLPTT